MCLLKRPPPPPKRRDSSSSIGTVEKRPPPPRHAASAQKQGVTPCGESGEAGQHAAALHVTKYASAVEPAVVSIDMRADSPENDHCLAKPGAVDDASHSSPAPLDPAPAHAAAAPWASTGNGREEGMPQQDGQDTRGVSLLERYREAARKAATGTTSRFASLALRPEGPGNAHAQGPRPMPGSGPVAAQTGERPLHPAPAAVPALGAGMRAPVKISVLPAADKGGSLAPVPVPAPVGTTGTGASLSQKAWEQIALLAELERQRQAFAKEVKEKAVDTDLGHAAAMEGCMTDRSYFSPSFPPVRWRSRGEGGWDCPCEGCDVELVPQNMDAEEQARERGYSGRHAVGFGASLCDAYHAFPLPGEGNTGTAPQREEKERRVFHTKALWDSVYGKPAVSAPVQASSLGPLGEPRPMHMYPTMAMATAKPQPLLPASEVAAIVRRVVEANKAKQDAPQIVTNPMRVSAPSSKRESKEVREPQVEETVLPIPQPMPQVPSRAPPPRPTVPARATTGGYDAASQARRSSVCSQVSESSWASQGGSGHHHGGRAEQVRQGAKAAAKAIGTRRNSLPVVIDASTGCPVQLAPLPARAGTSSHASSSSSSSFNIPVDSTGKPPPAVAPHSLLQAMAAAGMSREAERFIIRAGPVGDTGVVHVPVAPAHEVVQEAAQRTTRTTTTTTTTTTRRSAKPPPVVAGSKRRESLEARLAHIVKAANTVLQAHLAAKQKESMARLAAGGSGSTAGAL